MTRRLLPPEEWPKLDATYLGPLWRTFAHETRVVVVESADQIIACWCLYASWHLEGLWIAPTHRGHAGIARQLLKGMGETCLELGVRSAVTSADSPTVEAMLTHLHAERLPGQTYALRFAEPVDLYRSLGANFHAQLHVLLPTLAHHADDEAHHVAVGRALHVGVALQQPTRAEADYNAWAATHGYAQIRYVDDSPEGPAVDIVDAVVRVHRDFHLSLVEARVCQ